MVVPTVITLVLAAVNNQNPGKVVFSLKVGYFQDRSCIFVNVSRFCAAT